MTALSELETKLLRVCAGRIEQLPYSDRDRMGAASRRLQALGLAYPTFEDDQPTMFATEAGVLLVEQTEKTDDR